MVLAIISLSRDKNIFTTYQVNNDLGVQRHCCRVKKHEQSDFRQVVTSQSLIQMLLIDLSGGKTKSEHTLDWASGAIRLFTFVFLPNNFGFCVSCPVWPIIVLTLSPDVRHEFDEYKVITTDRNDG